MINTKKIRSNKPNTKTQEENSKQNSFFSLKNNREHQFSCEAERLLMVLFEFDPLTDAYRQFEFKMVNARNLNELESSPALILEGDGKRQYIILSDQLAGNERLREGVCEQLQKNESSPITLIVVPPVNIEDSILVKNISFLYKYALLPAYREDFSVISNLLEFCEELSINQLKRRVQNEAAIYQLMFHRALRADLESGLIDDGLIVNASPLINSILKKL